LFRIFFENILRKEIGSLIATCSFSISLLVVDTRAIQHLAVVVGLTIPGGRWDSGLAAVFVICVINVLVYWGVLSDLVVNGGGLYVNVYVISPPTEAESIPPDLVDVIAGGFVTSAFT
jgi:hypothetical protein